MNLRWLLVLVALLLGGTLLWWTLDRARAPSPVATPATPGEVRVARGDLAAFVAATARVEAERRARLALPAGATVVDVLVEIGDTVEEGQVLLDVDRTEFDLRLQEARAGFEAAGAQLARLEAGGAPGDIEAAQAQLRAAQVGLAVAEARLEELPEEQQAESPEAVQAEQARAALEQARAALRRLVDGATPQERAAQAAQVEQARARVAQAEAAVAAATLRAPFAGTVVDRAIGVGERATPAQALITIADLDTRVVVAEVDEVDVGLVAAGQPVTVTLDAFPARPLEGEVLRVALAAGAQRAATTYRTVIRFDYAELPVRLDMAADVRIHTAAAEDVLLLPQRAIRYAEAQPFVLVRRDGQVIEQDVALGARDDQMVQILRGVVEGEVVILP
jgi:HlyD family secretion protein